MGLRTQDNRLNFTTPFFPLFDTFPHVPYQRYMQVLQVYYVAVLNKKIMTNKMLLLLISSTLIIHSTNAQLGIFKKKKTDTNQTPDSVAAPAKEEKEEKKEKKGGNFFQKVVGKIAKGAGGVIGTKSTDNFSSFEPLVYFSSNLYGKEVGTMEIDFIPGWKKNSDLVTVMLMPADKLFFYKLDGSVKVDGIPADYLAAGAYSKIFEGSNNNKTLELETKNGKAKFVLIPNKNKIKVVSFNNSKENFELDMNKDFTIQLENFSTKPGAMVKIRVSATILGLRGLYDIGSFKPAASITIPGYILKHINTTNKGMSFKNCYLVIDDVELKEANDEGGKYKTPIKYLAGNSFAIPVKVTNDASTYFGFTVKAEEKLPLGKINYEFVKQNAFFARPTEQAKKIAVTTFAITGTTYYYNEKEDKLMQTRTEKELIFPQIPDATLNDILEKMYPQLTKVFQEELGAAFIAPEAVTGTKDYQSLDRYSYNDANTEENFSKSYKGLHPLPTTVPLAATYNGEPALFAATGANALLKVTLNLQLSWDNVPQMKPILTVEMLGDKNGGETGVLLTKFFTAKITGQGYKLKKGMDTQKILGDIVRQDDLMQMLRAGLKDLLAKEKQNGEYGPIWELQK